MYKNGKPRIAVCFSGQPRTWRKCVESWKENLFANTEMDVFCHIWDFNTLPNSIIVGEEATNVPVSREEINELFDVLKPTKFKIESARDFPLMKEDQVVRTPSFLSQYYGIMSAARLKREFEIENDFEYDIVIRMRYDAFFNNSVVSEFTSRDIDTDSMYCFHYFWNTYNNTGRVGDIFWYSSSQTYDIIADFVINIAAIEPKFFTLPDGTLKPDLAAESVFYYYIKKNDISFKINHKWNIKLFRESQELSFTKDLNGFEIW
jgi:hypothetical protein